MLDFEKPEFVETNGVTLPVYRAGPALVDTKKPPVFFLHGFPELAYSWRAQMEALGRAGYPVFAPDQRGFGKASKPDGRENYRMAHLTADLVGLLDYYNIEDAVFVGHDWGALVLWSMPFYCGNRVKGYAGLNVPLTRHYPVDPITMMRNKLGENMYIVRFQEEGACEPILEANVRDTFRFFMRKPKFAQQKAPSVSFNEKNLDLLALLQRGEAAWGGELLLSETDMQVYSEAYAAGGFTAPLHWYRNMTENWQAQHAFLVDGTLPKVEKPCLMITADLDRACPPKLSDGMEKMCTHYTRVDLKGCGHWSQQEQPEAVNRIMLKWLADNF